MTQLLTIALTLALTGFLAAPVRAAGALAASSDTASGPAGASAADSIPRPPIPFITVPSATDSIARSTTAPAESGAIARDSLASRMPRDVDYLWVLRTALLEPASIDSVVSRARAMHVRGLLVQVVGRGDAYYRSSILPRAEALGDASPDFDPLGEILSRAHAAGLEVHAWMNCLLVWSGEHRPRSPRHVVNAHAEWVTRLKDGRRMTQLTRRQLRRLGVEGVYLTPAHPAVRAWLGSIAREIATRYAVDGIHLDYIRQPDIAVGYDATTRARFALESGVDPARFSRIPPSRRPAVTAQWIEFQREQVTAVVRTVRDSLRAARSEVTLSAAVVADTVRAEHYTAQSWRAWMRDRLLDRVFLMCYSPAVQTVMDQLLALGREVGMDGQLVPGIAVYNTSTGEAALKIKGARALGYPLIALYSYDSLFSNPDQWGALQDHLRPAGDEGP